MEKPPQRVTVLLLVHGVMEGKALKVKKKKTKVVSVEHVFIKIFLTPLNSGVLEIIKLLVSCSDVEKGAFSVQPTSCLTVLLRN